MFERDARSEMAVRGAAATGRRGRVRLRSVDGELARLKALIGAGLCAELDGESTPLRLEVHNARPAASASPRQHQHLVLHTAGGPVSLTPAREIIRALTAIDLPDDHDTDPLHPLRMELATEAMPHAWFDVLGASATLSCASEAAGPVEVTLTLAESGTRLGLSATLRGTTEALVHALSHPAWQRLNPTVSPLPPNWTMKIPVHAGHTELSVKSCRALTPGDIIVVNQPCLYADGEIELRIGGRSAKCQLHVGNQTQLQLTEWDDITMGSTMKEPLEHSPYHSEHDDELLGDMPVVLSFELGTLELPLSELKTLAPGVVMPIAGAVPPEVTICAGGRRIGTGELVELDGRLGVEIRRIGAAS